MPDSMPSSLKMPRIVRWMAVTSLLAVMPVFAEDLESFRACVGIENDIARLECFDEAASELPDTESSDTAETEIDTGMDADQKPSPKSAEPETDKVSQKRSTSGKPYRPTRPEQILEADEKMVEDCEFLSTVVGKSGWGGLAAGAARKGATRSVKKRAAKLGATHVVILDFENGYGMKVSTLEGRAYRCGD